MKTALHRSSGVALVVTLILLAIITFMTVTFLVLSRSQRNVVAGTTEQARAAEIAKLGSRRALVEALAPVKAFNNLGFLDLRVSTNFNNGAGYQTAPGVPYPGVDFNPLNVSYAYPNGLPVTGGDYLQNLFNLYYSPRAPVYVQTNRNFPNAYDFRWYVDLNRNGRFETNGWLPDWEYVNGIQGAVAPVMVLASNGNPIVRFNYYVGDPEWIGVLEKPEYHHSATNLFAGRYAYIIIPASKTLDVNYVHNYAKAVYFGQPMPANPSDGFARNQGAGTFEINLAGFLADLNTNYWPLALSSVPGLYWWPWGITPPSRVPGYAYYPVLGGVTPQANGGWAFTHAMGLVRYRYTTSVANLKSVKALFGTAGASAFATDWVDDFASGPLMTGTWWPVLQDADVTPLQNGIGWPGSYNPYHFYTHQDFFDTNKTTTVASPYNLSSCLLSAGAGSNSYNRYTFYRMLAQLGTDTGPGDPENSRINLNYRNVDNYMNIIPSSATNFVPWDPAQFFTNTANRLFAKAGYTFGVTNIQLYPTNFYTASVHRLLQLAANIYDATTTNGFPSVFRPIFLVTHTNRTQVFIGGYEELIDHAGFIASPPNMHDLTVTNTIALNSIGSQDMIKGIPLVLGARKGFPNFNELELRTHIQTGRKLSFVKRTNQARTPTSTNEMYLLSITNEFGLEAWNSYTNVYPRTLQLTAVAEMTATITNELGQLVLTNTRGVTGSFSNYVAYATPSRPLVIPAGTWPGFNPNFPTNSFITPFSPAYSHFMFLTNSSYSMLNDQFVAPAQTSFEIGLGFPVPEWTLNLKTGLRFILFDTDAVVNGRKGRIVDYVNLANVSPPFNITTNLFAGAINTGLDGSPGSMFVTNRVGGANITYPTYGVINQIFASLGMNSNHLVWNSALSVPPPGWDTLGSMNFFRTNLLQLPPLPGKFQGPLYLTNRFESPYVATRDMYLYTSWQANDPLVHYTVGDLLPNLNTNNCDYDTSKQLSSTIGNIGTVNSRYEPWPGFNLMGNSGTTTLTDMRVKDPGVRTSSDWDFPTNKFPNPGWLGRVHRGTPWQTVYLKSQPIDIGTWQHWTGNPQIEVNVGQMNPGIQPLNTAYADAWITHPTNDWRLLDIFTTAFGDTAARGQLSINQTNLAAWSAVLAGVCINPTNNSFAVIQPAGAYSPVSPPPLITLYNAINDVRRTNYGGAFQRLGDFLSVPELTVRSPFLISSPTNVTDAVIERIPQQVLGLVKGGEQPRFVVYCYGQALKPADRSRVTSGPFLGLCTNYQITAETTTRAVVRIEGAPGNPHAVVESYNVLPPD